MYNSEQVINAVVLKCPYCGMDMLSTAIHEIKNYKRNNLSRFLSHLGIPFGITVTPKLVCPYNSSHAFFIKRGRIKKSK